MARRGIVAIAAMVGTQCTNGGSVPGEVADTTVRWRLAPGPTDLLPSADQSGNAGTHSYFQDGGAELEQNVGQAGTAGSGSGSGSPIRGDVQLIINEVKFDPPSTDGNYEFVELQGSPGMSLAGLWLVALEGDEDSNRGQVDLAIDLSKCSDDTCQFDRNGLLVLVPDLTSIALPVDAARRLSSELAKGGLENGTTTLLLLRGAWTGTPGSDWDGDDDGVLEQLPATLFIVDAVAWTDGGVADATYASVALGPKPKPQAIWSCQRDPETRQWRFGQLLGESASLAVDVAHSSPEGLSLFELTPGAFNVCQSDQLPIASANAGAAGAAGGPAFLGGFIAGGVTAGGSREIGSANVGGLTPGAGNNASLGGKQAVVDLTVAAGGHVTTSLQTNAGSSGKSNGHAGSSGTQVQVITASPLVPAAGNSGWWTPQPFPVAAAGHVAGALDSDVQIPESGGSSSSTPPSPNMPTSCAMPARPIGLFSDSWIAFVMALTATLRRRSPRRMQGFRYRRPPLIH